MENKERKAIEKFEEEVNEEMKIYTLLNDYTQKKIDNHVVILSILKKLKWGGTEEWEEKKEF